MTRFGVLVIALWLVACREVLPVRSADVDRLGEAIERAAMHADACAVEAAVDRLASKLPDPTAVIPLPAGCTATVISKPADESQLTLVECTAGAATVPKFTPSILRKLPTAPAPKVDAAPPEPKKP